MFSESKLPNSIVTGVVYWLIRNLTFVAYKIIHSEFVEAGNGGGGGGGGEDWWLVIGKCRFAIFGWLGDRAGIFQGLVGGHRKF